MNKLHTLHVLNKTPDHPRFNECLGMLGPDDAIILIENGVLGLLAAKNFHSAQVYALSADVSARGLSDSSHTDSLVDYSEWVGLTLQAERVISW
ncbi:sulfurtransferase complex subunit TusB [Marinobacter sp. F4206]|uniref:sulfurtransferase complex subunit TusB n=1 Tax=Marinobacter sp. F4206 TaxID=2861777 RepID=UPI001C5E38DB|nr:sulfurtransferase complex subunit TusB [Marinobacter sp. F4206]MBW4933283.1 sulfurtransferase complex subunit TusB [Marinobacter sp. F4206]